MIGCDLMNYDSLNKMVKYIEDNLSNEIDLNYLSNIMGSNLFIIERIFMFLTNMSIIDYIKKRRLSKAFEEIRNTNNKIIDIAFKYQYNSASSFNRAFKKLFNITPTECRLGMGSYKIIPIVYFENNDNNYNFEYEIKKIKAISLCCFHVTANSHDDLLYKIRELYRNVKKGNYYKDFCLAGMYGIFYKDFDTYHYYLGSTKYFSELEKYEIKENKYIIFRVLSQKQNDIVNIAKKIDKQWIPSTSYSVNNNMQIELYKDDYCYIYLPME